MRKLFPSLLVLIVLSACEIPDYFSDYRDVNIISGIPFSSSEWVQDDTSYMAYNSVTSTVAGGITGLPDGTTEYYRLEILNLVPNGDFEVVLSDWTSTGAMPTLTSLVGDAITGQSLSFSLLPDERADFDLNTLSDGFIANNIYTISFSIRTGDSFSVFDYNNTTESYSNSIFSPGNDVVNTFPRDGEDDNQINATTDSTRVLSIGAIDSGDQKLQIGFFDDLRMANQAAPQGITLTLPYTTTSGLDIIDGSYSFSLYAKLEEDDQVTPDVLNSFKTEEFSITMESLESPIKISTEVFTLTSEWTEYEMTLETQIETPSDVTTDMLKISIMAGNKNWPIPGRMLIASPSLEMDPDA